ncbi:MAG: CHAP domain-containing protein [Prosthecobacter sp.]|nr:CHAP domain-containing protein [Prosthecobacter sp.]
MKRRSLLVNSGIAFISSSFGVRLRAQALVAEETLQQLLLKDTLDEYQSGDPLEPDQQFERLHINTQKIQKAFTTTKVENIKDAKTLALNMLEITQQFADTKVSRLTDRPLVTEFLNLLDFDFKEEGKEVPFCAAGVTYAACRAFCNIDPDPSAYSKEISDKRLTLFKSRLSTIKKHYFYPSASVRVIKADAISRGTWVSPTVDPLPGWLVIFSWTGGLAGNHIGIVKSATKQVLKTIEYNTSGFLTNDVNANRNGGMVAEKDRPRNASILGFVKLYA